MAPWRGAVRRDSKGGTGAGDGGLRLGGAGCPVDLEQSDRHGTWRTLEGNKAHGRNERRLAGNGKAVQRTRRRSKALKSAASYRHSTDPRSHPPRRVRCCRPGSLAASAAGHLDEPLSGGEARARKGRGGIQPQRWFDSSGHASTSVQAEAARVAQGRFSGASARGTGLAPDDVGVRFGGSEHHRERMSASAPRARLWPLRGTERRTGPARLRLRGVGRTPRLRLRNRPGPDGNGKRGNGRSDAVRLSTRGNLRRV